MNSDLLTIADHEAPMGDLFLNSRLDTARAVWAAPIAGEPSFPDRRIVHQRVVRFHGTAKLSRLGLRRGTGYHKCGSAQYDLDWVAALRVFVWRKNRWHLLLHQTSLEAPPRGGIDWINFPKDCTASGVILEIRRSGIDAGWTPWNLAMSAFVLEGELLEPIAPRNEHTLSIEKVDLRKLPHGVQASHRDGEVRYVTRDFEVGFTLNRPGFSYLGLHIEDAANKGENLLNTRRPWFNQGPQLHPVGAAPLLAASVRCEIEGSVQVEGHRVIYDFSTGIQHYRLVWSVSPEGITLHATRSAEQDMQAWQSSAWTIGLRNSTTPTHALGDLLQDGETGGLALPALLVAPRFGAWQIGSKNHHAWLRSDCYRNRDLNTIELKMGETRSPEGTYLLPAGKHEAVFTLKPARPAPLLLPSAPAAARRAVERTQWTALTFRADTGTLSNNGASMHCPICMDTWSAISPLIGDVLPGLPATEFFRHSLERWLADGPGYASGRLVKRGKAHHAADEYLMTGSSALRGLGDYLHHHATREWFKKYRSLILKRLEKARGRDLDGDGLIESKHRTGVSGTGQWSTCWYDVISFGWKDAFANAILYGALRELASGFQRFDEAAAATRMTEWADLLYKSYRPAFWNDKTGWFAGWRCKEGKLHDHAFLPINGAAVTAGLLPVDEARAMLRRLLAEAERVGMPDASLGLPGSLHTIPDSDLTDIMHGYPLGYYQNGGRTHSQTRHFICALYDAGLTSEADRLLKRLCVGLAEARVYGGNQSGVDWRYWDDRPCGYEGLLTDQFGVLEPILRRWGKNNASRTHG